MDLTTLPLSDNAADLRAQLTETAQRLNADELAVVQWVAARMLKGKDTYGPLSVRTDSRDMLGEMAEEQIDTAAYGGIEFVKSILPLLRARYGKGGR